MKYLEVLFPSVKDLSRSDLSRIEIEGMRRNSFIVTLCSLATLASISIVGANLFYLLPIVVLAVVSFVIGVFLEEKYLLAAQRLLVALSFLAVSVLVSYPVSVSSLALFVPIFTFIYCTERVRIIRVVYSILIVPILLMVFLRSQSSEGVVEVSALLLNVKIAADSLMATVFTGMFLRMYSVYSRVTIEVTKAHAVKLDHSVKAIETTIGDLESHLQRLSEIQKKTAKALANERMASGEIKASQEQMFQFAYAASHDLKEPIRTVRSFYQVIRRRVSPEVLAKAEIADLFSWVEERTASMHAMLERLLQFSRISSHQTFKKECSIRELAHRAMSLSSVSMDLSLDIRKRCEQVVMDPSCLNQVLQELIRNSVAFSSPIRPLEISLVVEKSREGYLMCSFRDNGLGMSEEVRAKAFDLFQRFDGPQGGAGSGIGLSIVKAIIAKEGGEVSLLSDGVSGTTVQFELPTSHQPTGDLLECAGSEGVQAFHLDEVR